MLFSSSVFLFAFLPIVLLVYYGPLRKLRRGQNLFLLAASLFFYAFGEPRFVLVMIASILFNWLMGLWVGHLQAQERSTRPATVCAVVFNLGLLFVFKYLTFVLANLNRLGAQIVIPGIELPIGISFFTFQALSYVIDVARKKEQAQRSLLAVGLYISFFPQLIAGPIVTYGTVAEQLYHRQETWSLFSSGVCRFLVGLGKKVLLSNQLALIADSAFAARDGLSTALAWLGGVCYALQIYYDFSGYSDMAIGLGRMFGFEFLENFNYPYAATSLADYWRRWHLSLTTWFRDYLYIPLGGSRVSPDRHVLNMLIVWFLTGLWHGANWTYVGWGLYSFAVLMVEKKLDLTGRLPVILQRVYALLAITFSVVIFRAESLRHAGQYLLAMFGVTSGGLTGGAAFWVTQYFPELVLSVLFAVPFARWVKKKLYTLKPLCPVWDVCYALGMLGILVLSATALIKGSYNPFIYFNF